MSRRQDFSRTDQRSAAPHKIVKSQCHLCQINANQFHNIKSNKKNRNSRQKATNSSERRFRRRFRPSAVEGAKQVQLRTPTGTWLYYWTEPCHRIRRRKDRRWSATDWAQTNDQKYSMASAGDSSTGRASCTAEQCGNRKRHPLYEITKCRVLINLNHECHDYYYIPWMASPVLFRLLAQMEWQDINRRLTVKTKDQIVNEFAIYRIKRKMG